MFSFFLPIFYRLVNTLIQYSIELKNEVELLKLKLKSSEEKLIEKESIFYVLSIQLNCKNNRVRNIHWIQFSIFVFYFSFRNDLLNRLKYS